jgi:hypothetical protein
VQNCEGQSGVADERPVSSDGWQIGREGKESSVWNGRGSSREGEKMSRMPLEVGIQKPEGQMQTCEPWCSQVKGCMFHQYQEQVMEICSEEEKTQTLS